MFAALDPFYDINGKEMKHCFDKPALSSKIIMLSLTGGKIAIKNRT